MRQLLKSNEARRLLLVETLHQKNEWISLAQLAKLLDCSERVLKDDLAYFRENKATFQIITSYQGVRIEFKPNSGSKEVYQQILSQSLAFRILEIVLVKEDITIEDLVEVLFVSDSTIYRIIQRINHALKEYFDIELVSNPLKLRGKESKIRLFYYTYYAERNSKTEWRFPTDDKDANLIPFVL